MAHRLAWLYVYGEWPKDMIDHVNGDGTFNAISNLREADNTLNKQNQRIPNKNSKSKLLGAYARKEKFRSQIMVNRKAIGLGTYETAEEAHQAYLSAKRELHRSCTI